MCRFCYRLGVVVHDEWLVRIKTEHGEEEYSVCDMHGRNEENMLKAARKDYMILPIGVVPLTPEEKKAERLGELRDRLQRHFPTRQACDDYLRRNSPELF